MKTSGTNEGFAAFLTVMIAAVSFLVFFQTNQFLRVVLIIIICFLFFALIFSSKYQVIFCDDVLEVKTIFSSRKTALNQIQKVIYSAPTPSLRIFTFCKRDGSVALSFTNAISKYQELVRSILNNLSQNAEVDSRVVSVLEAGDQMISSRRLVPLLIFTGVIFAIALFVVFGLIRN